MTLALSLCYDITLFTHLKLPNITVTTHVNSFDDSVERMTILTKLTVHAKSTTDALWVHTNLIHNWLNDSRSFKRADKCL